LAGAIAKKRGSVPRGPDLRDKRIGELLARQPKELWSWDITKLLGLAKWTYFYLYVMLDVFSRYVVGWMVAHPRERRSAFWSVLRCRPLFCGF
jgi:transposase InsO family protein